jgi:hypothetical protein
MNDSLNYSYSSGDRGVEDSIVSMMDSLSKTITWFILSLVFISIPVYGESILNINGGQNGDMEFFGLTIPKDSASVVLFLLVLAMNLYIYKQFKMIRDYYNELVNKEKINLIIRKHPLIVNPFSKSRGGALFSFDYIGYVVLFILWWEGFALVFRLNFPLKYDFHTVIVILFAILYTMIGFLTRDAIDSIIDETNGAKWKNRITNIAVVVSIFVICLINKDLIGCASW